MIVSTAASGRLREELRHDFLSLPSSPSSIPGSAPHAILVDQGRIVTAG